MNSLQIGYKSDVIQYYKTIKKGCKDKPYHFIIEGLWGHEKLMTTDVIIEKVIYCPDLIRNPREREMINKYLTKTTQCYQVSEKTMTRMSTREQASCMVAVCYLKPSLQDFKRVVVLDNLEKPGNIGTIFRTCDGAGIDAIFVVNSPVKINQYKVIKASMGGCFNVPWFHFDSVESCHNWLSDHEFTVCLANPQSSTTEVDQERVALVVGNERFGLSKEWFKLKHTTLSIEMKGCCDSLNVGVAASILIYKHLTG